MKIKIKVLIWAFLLVMFTNSFAGDFSIGYDDRSVATGITFCFANKKFLEKKHNLPAASDLAAHLFKVKYNEMESRFESLGAELQFYDYPFIPFDDYYTNDYFGFVRIKVLPENTDKAVFLVFELIKSVKNFSEKDLAIAVKSAKGSNMMRNRFKKQAFNTLWGKYFPHSYLVMPDYCYNPKFESDAFKTFLNEYLSSENIFVSVYGKFDRDKTKKTLERFLGKGKVELNPYPEISIPEKDFSVLEKNSKQAYVIIAAPVEQNLSLSDIAKLRILISLASGDISFQIREKEGLAYSVGCSLVFKGGRLFALAYCATNPEKAEYVAKKIDSMFKDALTKELKLSEEQLDTARNKLLLSDTLKTLPNVNKSFFQALYRLTGCRYYDKKSLDNELKKVKIKRLCGSGMVDYNRKLLIILK